MCDIRFFVPRIFSSRHSLVISLLPPPSLSLPRSVSLATRPHHMRCITVHSSNAGFVASIYNLTLDKKGRKQVGNIEGRYRQEEWCVEVNR